MFSVELKHQSINPSNHLIDEFLVLKFLEENSKTDEDILYHLIKWKSAIEYSMHEEARLHAINFLISLGDLSLDSIGYPEPQKRKIIEIFNPLETILKTTLSLKEKGKIRDHLNHTVRVVLFSNYIYGKLKRKNSSEILNKLNIAAIFHDIAYPIEKIKFTAHNFTNETFSHYLNSNAKLDIEISDPTNLLKLLDFVGNLNNYGDPKTKQRIIKLYTKIIVPAIASQGLFEAPHCLSSVVLFLRPLIANYSEMIEQYWKGRINDICDISFAIANHDRKDLLDNSESIDCIISKSLRIADELQEWERDAFDLSFIEKMEFVNNTQGNLLNIVFHLKDRTDGEMDKRKFIPEIYISDKIIGLFPTGSASTLIIDFYMPDQLIVSNLISIIEKSRVKIAPSLSEKGLYIHPELIESNRVRMIVNSDNIILRHI